MTKETKKKKMKKYSKKKIDMNDYSCIINIKDNKNVI